MYEMLFAVRSVGKHACFASYRTGCVRCHYAYNALTMTLVRNVLDTNRTKMLHHDMLRGRFIEAYTQIKPGVIAHTVHCGAYSRPVHRKEETYYIIWKWKFASRFTSLWKSNGSTLEKMEHSCDLHGLLIYSPCLSQHGHIYVPYWHTFSSEEYV